METTQHKTSLKSAFTNSLLANIRNLLKDSNSIDSPLNTYEDLFISKLAAVKCISYDKAEVIYKRYKVDPEYFITDFLKSPRPWNKEDCIVKNGPITKDSPEMGQRAIILSVRDNKNTTVRSGHGIGKGWTAGRVALWFLHCFPPCIVLTTAPTNRGVEKLLWGEIRSAYKKALFMISECLTKEIKFADDWFAIGFSSNKEFENFTGYHSPNILIIEDEASGISKLVDDALDRNLTSYNARRLKIGNPNDTSGPFYRTFKNSAWNKIHIDTEVSPNVLHDKEVVPGLSSKQWCDKRKKEYGKGPLFEISVKGNFSESGSQQVATLKQLERNATIKPAFKSGKHLGIDIARSLDKDATTLYLVEDNVVIDKVKWHEPNLMKTVGKIINYIKKWEVEHSNCHMDIIGIGAGVYDRLREQDYAIDAVDFGSKKLMNHGDYRELIGKKVKALNRRAELHWIFKRLMEDKLFSIPEKFKDAWTQAQATKYDFKSSGEIFIIPKDEIKEELGCSPDDLDAIIYSLARKRSATQFR